MFFSLTRPYHLGRLVAKVHQTTPHERKANDYMGKKMFGKVDEEYQKKVFNFPRYMKFGRII